MEVTDTHVMWVLGMLVTACAGFITFILSILGYFLKTFKEDVGSKLDQFSASLIEFGNKTVAIATSLEHAMNAHQELKQELKAHEKICAVEFKGTGVRIANLEKALETLKSD